MTSRNCLDEDLRRSVDDEVWRSTERSGRRPLRLGPTTCLTGLMLAWTMLPMSSVRAEEQQPDIVIADFTGEDWGGWKTEGDAFGSGPVEGLLPEQDPRINLSGALDKRFANSGHGSPRATGKLISPPFVIQRKYINAHLCGSNRPKWIRMDVLVDGRVIGTASGYGRFGGWRWRSLDVTEFLGKTAHIEFVDEPLPSVYYDISCIMADRIVQSDRSTSRRQDYRIDSEYLYLPLDFNAPTRHMLFRVDGKLVDDINIRLAEDEPAVWANRRVSAWKGKTLEIEIEEYDKPFTVEQGPTMRLPKHLYQETHRPQFHFSPRWGWQNDPVGLMYHQGEYHLFFGYNPYGKCSCHSIQGHAVSKDLFHWRERDFALEADELGWIYSGSGVVDENNTTGFAAGSEKPLVLIYTAAGGNTDASADHDFTICLAYSNDRGQTWTKYAGNPVLGTIRNHNRDPKVFWHEPTQRWVMLLYLGGRDFAFLSSPDLKKWEWQSQLFIPESAECPDMFELPVDGDPGNRKWVVLARGAYGVGAFDGRKFDLEGEWVHRHSEYAGMPSQTFNHAPDGRVIQVCRWNSLDAPGLPALGQMTLPCELSLRTTETGIRMFAWPVKELETLRARKHEWTDLSVSDAERILEGVDAELLDIEAELEIGEAGYAGLAIRGIRLAYDQDARQLVWEGPGHRSPRFPLTNGRIRLRIVVDRTSLEIFAQDGAAAWPLFVALPPQERSVVVFAKKGSCTFRKLTVHELKSTWPKAAGSEKEGRDMEEITQKRIKLTGLEVEVSKPVLVKRSRWFCWFPSLIRQPNGTLWAVMHAHPDIHVSASPCFLSRSRDGGLSWDEARVIGDGGLNYLILNDGSALILPYYLRMLGPDKIGAPYNLISPDGELSYSASGVTVTGWPRPPTGGHITSPIAGAAGFLFNGQVVRGKNMEYLTTLYGQFQGDRRCSLVLAESADGVAWKIRSIIAGADCPLEGSEGPCESAICRLKDGRLMCVFRLYSYTSYGRAFSSDDGLTWTAAELIGPKSVEPSLAVLDDGTVALSGGRPGIYVWFSADGEGREWQPLDIVATHNALVAPVDQIEPDTRKLWDKPDTFEGLKSTDRLRQLERTGFTSSYTEILPLDGNTLLLIYDRIGYGWHAIPDDSEESKSVWVMRLKVTSR